MSVFERNVLKTYECKRADVTDELRKVQNKKRHNMLSSLNIVRMIK